VSQPADENQRGCRLGVAHHAVAHLAEIGEILAPGEEGGDLHDVVRVHLGSGEYREDVAPDLLHLGRGAFGQLAIGIDAHLA
jgi:hypothetical protein